MMTKWKEAHWRENGWVSFDGLLDGKPKERLSQWVAEVAMTPETAERRRHHYEETAQGATLCRTEEFLQDHEALNTLVTGSELVEVVAALLGDDATIHGEKINYKQPGGAGFSAHQDAATNPCASRRIVCLVAVDPMTPKNGCLEFASGRHDRLLASDDRGYIQPELAETLPWQAVPLPVGGVVFFSPLTPHRSAPNSSTWPRRALYLNYRPRGESRLRNASFARSGQAMVAF